MLSVVQLEPGSQSEVHSHPPEQWGVIIAGSGVPIQDGVEHPETIGDFGAHHVMYHMHFEQVQMGQRCWISSVRRGTNIERPGPGSSLQILEDWSTAGHKTVLAWTQ